MKLVVVTKKQPNNPSLVLVIIFANIDKTVSIYTETMNKSRDSQLLDNYDDLHAFRWNSRWMKFRSVYISFYITIFYSKNKIVI